MNSFNLEQEIQQMLGEHQGNSTDRHTKVLAKTESYRILLVSLKKNAQIHEHQVEGRLFLQTLQGEIQIGYGNEKTLLPHGHLITLPPKQTHNVSATQDSVFLLTITQLNR